MPDMSWKEPLRRVEDTLKGEIKSVGERVERTEKDIDDIKAQNREIFAELRQGMQTMSDKLDRRHEDMMSQNEITRNLVDKLAVIENRNSRDLDTVIKKIDTMSGSVHAQSVLVQEMKTCFDKRGDDIDELKEWKAEEAGRDEGQSKKAEDWYRNINTWIAIAAVVVAGVAIWLSA